MARQLGDGADIGGLVGIGVEREVFGDLPDEDLQARTCQWTACTGAGRGAGHTLPSSEPEAMIESSKGFLSMGVRVGRYQSRGL